MKHCNVDDLVGVYSVSADVPHVGTRRSYYDGGVVAAFTPTGFVPNASTRVGSRKDRRNPFWWLEG